MPDGVMWWFDPDDGEGRILHSGRVFAVQAEDTERSARVAGARVHFDVDSRAEGTASNVTLRRGKRVSRGHRRFGDLTGARRADTTGAAAHAVERPDLGRDLERHPARVAENWAEMLAVGRVESVVAEQSVPMASDISTEGDVTDADRALVVRRRSGR